jgi:hypothetical protein
MWLPPVVQQVTHEHGNLSGIVKYFLHPVEHERHSVAAGFRLVSGQFGLVPEWLTGHRKLTPSSEPVMLTSSPLPVWLVPFLIAVIVLWRRRAAAAGLAFAVCATLGLGVLWVARTPGPVWDYRLGWTWIIAMVAFVTMAWTVWVVASSWALFAARRFVVAGSMAALVALGFVNGRAAARAPTDARSPRLASLTRQVVAALPAGHGDVILRLDANQSAIYGAGLFVAFEKRGLPVRTDNGSGLVGTDAPHRVHRRGPVRVTLFVRIGDSLFTQLGRPGAQLVASWDYHPTSSRSGPVRQLLALERAHAAGRVDDNTYRFVREVLHQRLGNAVGVFVQAAEPKG